MAEEISGEIKLLHDQFLTASKETTAAVTVLGQRMDAVFKQAGVSSEAGISAVVAQLAKLDAKFAKTVADSGRLANSLKFDKLAEGLSGIGDKAGAAFSGAIDGGQKYEAAINRVRAISGLGGADIQQLNKDIEELGRKFGFAVGPTQTAEIALQALGSGFETVAESTKIAKSSLMLIADGTTSATDATKLLVGTLNAYGQGADSAAKITDQMFQVQNRGVVTISQMSQTLGLVTSTAAAAGIGFEELGAAIIVATKKNIPFSSAVDGMRGLLERLENPTELGSKAMLKYSLAINYATLRQKGLGATLKEIKSAVGDDAAALKEIAGDQQAFGLATALTSDNLKGFDAEVKGLENSTGAAAKSTSILAEGLENRTAAFAAATERLKVSVTKDVLPLATAFVKFSTEVVDAISALPAPIKNLGLLLTGLAAGLGLVAGTGLAIKGTLALFGVEAIGAGAAMTALGSGVKGLLAFDFAKMLPTVAGIRGLGLAAKTAAVDGIASMGTGITGMRASLAALPAVSGLAIAGTIGFGIALAGATKYAIDQKFALDDLESSTHTAMAGFSAMGKAVTELRSSDIVGNSAKDLVETFGANIDSLRSAALRERSQADNASEESVRQEHLKTFQLIKAKEKELNDYLLTLDAKQQQAIVTAAQEKEAYKDALERIKISKDDGESKANQLRALILQYRLVGDERRTVETLAAAEEDKAAKKSARIAEKKRSEGVKDSIQEVENSKKTTDEKIKDLQRILKTANLSGNERRAIEDRVLAHEKTLTAERQKLADRQKKIAIDASQEKVKIAEHELDQLRKLAEKGVDTTPDQVQRIKVKASEEKHQVDVNLKADLAKDKDPTNQADLRSNAARAKADIERASQDAITETVDKGNQDRLQRQQQATQAEIAMSERRSEQLAKYSGPGQGTFLLQAEAARRIALMIQEINLQKELTQSQTQDPAAIAQAETLAQQQILDARIKVREEIDATTAAIEEQQKKSKAGRGSNEMTGNILSMDQFLQGEKDRFTTRTADEFFGAPKKKGSTIPGLSDFEIRQGILSEANRDPSRRGAGGAADGVSGLAARGAIPVAISGTFRLVDNTGKEAGRLERLTVNGRNSDLSSETKAMGL